jgi:copper chaperone
MLRFTVPSIACGGCAKGVTRAIQGVDTDARVETDTAEREVRVESAKANEAALLAALQSAGYPAERKLAPIG